MELTTYASIRLKYLTMGPKQVEELRKQVDYLLAQGLIRHSKSNVKYFSPCILVQEKDPTDSSGVSESRIVNDFRASNAKTVVPSYSS